MRIAYLINQYPKASHTFIRREIRTLERLGLEIHRFSIRGWNEPIVDQRDQTERSQTSYILRQDALTLLLAVARSALLSPLRFFSALKLVWSIGRNADRPLAVHFAYLAEACYLAGILAARNIQHLHAHFGTNSASVAMLVNVLSGIPWSFTVHGPEEFDRARQIALREKIALASFVVAISSFGRSQLLRLCEYKNWKKIHVIRCGLEKYEVPTLPCPKDNWPTRFLCIARLTEQKGLMILLRAARKLRCDGHRFEVSIAGDGELRGEMLRYIEDNQLQSYVHMLGWIDFERICRELESARALVLPSFAEGLPVAIMEAMALRRPAISTYIAGIPELVVPSANGWLVPAGDSDALANAMSDCLSAPSTRLSKMADASYQRVWRMHDLESESQKLGSLFKHKGQPRTDSDTTNRGAACAS